METTGMNEASLPKRQASMAAWKGIVAKYQEPSTPRAVWQMINTLGPYALLWYLMYRSLTISWWLLVPLGILAGAFLVRTFIIFHDCGHGSYFRSRIANDVVGFITGMLTFTPYYHWRWEHAIHHATAGRSEEHTSELQSQSNLVCRLLLEKKKKTINICDQTTLISLLLRVKP